MPDTPTPSQTVAPDTVQPDIPAPSQAVAPNTDTVQIVNPQTGAKFEIPNTADWINDAKGKGYAFNTPVPQNLDLSYLQDEEKNPETALLFQQAKKEKEQPSNIVTPPDVDSQQKDLLQKYMSGQITRDQYDQQTSSLQTSNLPQETTRQVPSLSDIDVTHNNNVRFINPKTGEEFQVPNDPYYIFDLKDKGYLLPSEINSEIKQSKQNQQKVQQYQDQFAGEYGTGRTFAGSLLQGIFSDVASATPSSESELMQTKQGDQEKYNSVPDRYIDVLKRHHVPEQDIPLAVQALDNLEQTYPKAKNWGNVAETGAEVLAAAPAAEAAATGAAGALGLETGSLGARVVGSVVRNPILASRDLADDVVNQDYGRAGATVALMLGTDVILGGLGSVAKAIIPKKELAHAVALRSHLDSLGADRDVLADAAKEVGFKDEQELFDKAYKYITPEQMSKMGLEEKGNFFNGLGKTAGEEIGNFNNIVDKTSAKDLSAEGVRAAQNLAQKQAEDFGTTPLSYVQDNILRVDAEAISQRIKNLADKVTGRAEAGLIDNALGDVADKLSRAKSLDGTLSLTEAQQLQTLFSNRAFNKLSSDNFINRQISGIVASERQNAIERFLTAKPNAKLASDYFAAKEKYQLSKIFSGSDLKSEAANNFNNLLNVGMSTHGGLGSALGHAAIGGSIGAAVGGPLGAVIGSVGGMIAGKGLRYYLAEKGLTNISGTIARATAAEAPSLSIIGGAQYMAHKLSTVAPALVAAGMQRSERPSVIKTMLGEEANGLSKNQQVERIIQKISPVANDQHWVQRQTEILSDFKNYPKIIPTLGGILEKQRSLLLAAIPQSNIDKPFQKTRKAKYSPEQLSNLEDVIRLSNDPFSILEDLKAGTISAKQVSIIADIYPQVLNEMQQEIWQRAKNIDFTLQQRLIVSVLLQQPADRCLNIVGELQSGYTAALPAPDAAGPRKKASHKGASSDATSYATSYDRILNK